MDQSLQSELIRLALRSGFDLGPTTERLNHP